MITYILCAIITAAIAFILYENYNLKKNLKTKNDAYNVIRKAYNQERDENRMYHKEPKLKSETAKY